MNAQLKTYVERNGRLAQEKETLRRELRAKEQKRMVLIEYLRAANQRLRKLERECQKMRSFTLRYSLQEQAETVVNERRKKREAELDFAERPVAELVGVCNKVPQKQAEDRARTIVKAMEASNFTRHEAARAAYWLIESRQRYSVRAIEQHLQRKVDEDNEVSDIAECELSLLRFVVLRSEQDDQKVLEGVKA